MTRITHAYRVATLFVTVLFAACGASADLAPTVPGSDTPQTPAVGGSLNGRRPFPADNPWNADISAEPVDPASATLIAACGVRNLHPDFGTAYGIPYVLVGGSEPKRAVSFDYASESDAGPYPIPPSAPIEGGVQRGAIDHALRFTCPRTRKGFITPARHHASVNTSASLPPMCMRVRLKQVPSSAFEVVRMGPITR